MTNFRKVFNDFLPLTITRVTAFLHVLMHRIVIDRTVVDELHLMQTGSDITSYISVAELVDIAETVKSGAQIFIYDNTDPTLKGGYTTAINSYALYNPGTDASVCFGWIDKGTSSVIYKELEFYVDYSTNKVKLANAFYKSL